MENIQISPVCGAANLPTCVYCEQCAQALSTSILSREEAGSFSQFSQKEEPPFLGNQKLQDEQTRPPRRIVRPSNRRKFLVGLLGSGAILAAGSVGLFQLAQNVRVALNTKGYPYNFWDHLVGESYSSDLNFMAMIKVGEEDSPQAKLYIWDYQQQYMTTLPTGPSLNGPAWSPDNRYLLFQTYHLNQPNALDLWNVQAQQKLRTYMNDDYIGYSAIHWSPDGSQIALLSTRFVIMSPTQLTPLLSFNHPNATTDFTWSPYSQKVAFLNADILDSTWDIQIWDLQTQKMESEIAFQGQNNHSLSALVWSPDGAHLAVLARGQLQVIQVGHPLTSYALDIPNDGGLLAWSPDGRYLAVAVREPNGIFSSSSRFGVWDIVERKQVRAFNDGVFSTSIPDALTWSKDGKFIRVIANVYQQENWDWL